MSRRDIIKYLVEKESVLGLARDIAKVGLSPLDMFGAVAAPEGGYTILEGNRRLCALILLHDPTLAPSKERNAFNRLSQKFDPELLVIELTVFDDEESADLWIDRKHAGPGSGNGPRSWNAVQLARRYGDRTGNALALALLDYAQARGMITKAEAESGIITTVTRFVSNPFVRTHGLGITTGAAEADFRIAGTQSLFNKRLLRLLSDIVAKRNNATSRTSSADRAKYAQEHLVPLTDDDAEAGEEPTTGGDTSGGTDGGTTDGDGDGDGDGHDEDEGGEGDGKPKGGSKVHPSNRAKLIPDTFNPSFRDERLKRVLAEAKSIRRATPLAAALVARVFIESITVTYLESRGATLRPNDKLHLLVHNVLTQIDKGRKEESILLTRAEASSLDILKSQVSQQNYVYSAFYLGSVAHGAAFPEWTTLTAKWDEIQPILAYISINAEPAIEPE